MNHSIYTTTSIYRSNRRSIELIWAARTRIERMSLERYRDLQTSGVMADQIQYGQILHYTRVNPVEPLDIRPYFSWMRSVCPWDTKLSLNGWVAIERPTYDASMLFAVAERVPRMIVSDEYVTETYERGEGAKVFQQQPPHDAEHRLRIIPDEDQDQDGGTYFMWWICICEYICEYVFVNMYWIVSIFEYLWISEYIYIYVYSKERQKYLIRWIYIYIYIQMILTWICVINRSHEENQGHTENPSVFHPSGKESGRDDETGARATVFRTASRPRGKRSIDCE